MAAAEKEIAWGVCRRRELVRFRVPHDGVVVVRLRQEKDFARVEQGRMRHRVHSAVQHSRRFHLPFAVSRRTEPPDQGVQQVLPEMGKAYQLLDFGEPEGSEPTTTLQQRLAELVVGSAGSRIRDVFMTPREIECFEQPAVDLGIDRAFVDVLRLDRFFPFGRVGS